MFTYFMTEQEYHIHNEHCRKSQIFVFWGPRFHVWDPPNSRWGISRAQYSFMCCCTLSFHNPTHGRHIDMKCQVTQLKLLKALVQFNVTEIIQWSNVLVTPLWRCIASFAVAVSCVQVNTGLCSGSVSNSCGDFSWWTPWFLNLPPFWIVAGSDELPASLPGRTDSQKVFFFCLIIDRKNQLKVPFSFSS